MRGRKSHETPAFAAWRGLMDACEAHRDPVASRGEPVPLTRIDVPEAAFVEAASAFQASLDLGLALFRIGERYGARFGEDPGPRADNPSELARRSAEVAASFLQHTLLDSAYARGLTPLDQTRLDVVVLTHPPEDHVAGLPLRDAARRMHALGVHVRVRGTGYVTETRPAVGAPVARGDTLVLVGETR